MAKPKNRSKTTELRLKKSRFPRTSMGTRQNAMSRTLTSKLWRTRAPWPPQAESHWRTDFKALVPAPNSTEIVMLKSHVERGLSMLPSSFFTNLLKFYGLQLHHIAPNSLVSIAGYAALCEGFLGIRPRVDLFQLFFSVRANYEDDGFL
jgi:hypothetical protein